MNNLGDRHSGTLDGRLLEPGPDAVIATVRIEPAYAANVAVQHTAWMVVNLLARLADVVSAVRITGGDAPLRSRIIPIATGASSLIAGLIEGAAAVGGVPASLAEAATDGIELTVGPGEAVRGWRVHGEGYCGAISRRSIRSASDSPLPIGPYIAACLAASEVFRQVRLRPDLYDALDELSFSAWDYSSGPGSLHCVGPELRETALDFGLAGAGAVGCALLHTLWACPTITGNAVIADSDPKGIDATNLNRCVIFGREHIGLPKASTACRILRDAGIAWDPVDGPYARAHLSRVPEVLVSAVDTNRSRDQLQQGFWPARLLAASTKNLRAEILRCGPPGEGPCLRCFNPPEIDLPDDIRREQLRDMDPKDLDTFAASISQPGELVRRWANEGGCGEVGDAAIQQLRNLDQPPTMFSVGFVSVLAGTVLAAEVIKEHVGRDGPLDDRMQSAKFQFERPAVSTNGRPQPTLRDPACPACASLGDGLQIWRSRAAAWRPVGSRRLPTG